MDSPLTLEDVRRAAAARDPDLARLVLTLAAAEDPDPAQPVREGAPTLARLVGQLQSRTWRKKPTEEQRHFRVDQLARLEAADAEVPLPDRLRLHQVLLDLWADDGAYARRQLLDVIAEVPLRWGPWRAIKRIFKEAEARQDLEVYGAIAARLDRAFAERGAAGEVTRRTVAYLVRRAWRFLRRTAESMPAVYADAAVEILRFYPEDMSWAGTWIANHVFYHGTGEYSRRRFRFRRRPSTLLKYRAFPELWRRTPRPLFTLLERARSEQARRFATDALRTDFRASLREVEPSWVARLVTVQSRIVDDFVIWLLDNVPRFEQEAFRTLGLHAPVLALLDSPSDNARAYAAAYARTHARDLPLDELIRLANNDHDGVRGMVRDLLRDRDPRTEVGLDAWGRLLGTPYGHELAAAALRKHFGARELTPEWFAARLRSSDDEVVEFAAELLPRVHPEKKLGAEFFRDLLDAPELSDTAAELALDALERFDPGALGVEFLRRLLLNPNATWRAREWVQEERVDAAELGVDYLKAIGFEGTFAEDAWIAELKRGDRPWARDLEFDEDLSELALGLLSDVRRFSPDQVGFDWLMQLVQRSESRYHDFAEEYMTKAFLPADFAPKKDAEKEEAPAAEAKPSGEINVDLAGASFLFTGALATMTRSEATKKVSAANGTNASGVTAKLDYLVVGDEGSPLYGAGRKGSKQVKAESLIEKGAPMRIISETAFLQMLAGEQRSFDEGAVTAGCERLWEMATGPGKPDAPLARFARHYLRMHHPEICRIETDRHVDPGAEIPEDFLTFERVRGLLGDPRAPIRELGLELSRFELARWAPPMDALVALSELPYDDVRAFVTEALTAEDTPDTRRYRIDPAVLTADAVYRFCESLEERARELGMTLIARNPRLAIPDELFRLTESPDRQVRAFVIRQLWALYRDRGITEGWQPAAPPPSKSKKKAAEAVEAPAGPPPKPAAPPAEPGDVRDFLRRTLFGIPPAKVPARPETEGPRLKPLPARKAKLALIEVVRDLALEDARFAGRAVPLLREFLGSRGQSEHAACLVALTRLRRAHPDLPAWQEAA